MNMSDGITPQHKYVVFGETPHNTTESKFTYANALTLDIMLKLAEDDRFDECTQADVVNLALILLYGFIAPEDHDKTSKKKLHEFIDDFEDFKDFAMFTMNTCRRNNTLSNEVIDELIEEKETAK